MAGRVIRMWVPRCWPGSWCLCSDGRPSHQNVGSTIWPGLEPHSDDRRPSEHKHHDMARIGTHILMAGRVIRMWVPRSWPGSWCLCSDGRPSHQNVGSNPGQDRGAHILMARPSHQNVGSTILARIVVLVF